MPVEISKVIGDNCEPGEENIKIIKWLNKNNCRIKGVSNYVYANSRTS